MYIGGPMANTQWQWNTGELGDTTYTKIFVGGLSWETERDTMQRYFEQFGEILEAVVITDRVTGRSKGYGFVTFKDADSACRACLNSSPVIDGRRANCNLAYLGARPSQQSSQGGSGYRSADRIPAYHPHGTFYSYPQGSQYTDNHIVPYPTYELIGYSQENIYPMSYYNPYGGHYYPGTGAFPNAGIYQCYTHYTQSSLKYPHMVQYTHYMPQQQSRSHILSLPTIIQSNTGSSTATTAEATSSQPAGGGNSDENSSSV